jgi:prephenate dehydratase
MTTITLGPEGTFSHELAQKLGCEPIRFVPTIHGIVGAVARGEGDGIAPIENSEAGSVGETLDALSRYPVYITGEMLMPIHHHLASRVPLEKITVIYAHPQTHEQCSELIENWQIPVVHTLSNAASAIEAAKGESAAAIIPALAARLYDLPIIMRHIENNHANVTRFVWLSRNRPSSGSAEKCSLLIDPSADRAGLLHEILSVFAKKGINLTRIESRPSKRGIGTYVFFLDVASTHETASALDELRGIATIKELGCYSRIGVT